jgi:tripartite-type tricarboxylate transporter receptor subunit TctC
MLRSRLIVWTFSVGMIVLGANVASGQNYPIKPIRIVTTEPGSTTELVGRLIAQGLTGSLGQQVIVENRGITAIETVAKATPDGYTLLLYTSPLWLTPFLRDNVTWDPVRDFLPITLTVGTPNVLVVHPSLPVKSVEELIALAKARPGELNYGSGSAGASPHLSAELFKAMAGVDLVRVPFRGTGPALNTLIGGQLQLMFPTAGSVTSHVESGRLRALAVTTARPSALAPGLPTVAASGLPGYESISLSGMLAPARTPATIIGQLNQEVVRVLNRAAVKGRLFNVGVEVIASSPEEFASKIKSEMAKWGKVIRDAGIRE